MTVHETLLSVAELLDNVAATPPRKTAEFVAAMERLDAYAAACTSTGEQARIIEIIGVIAGVKPAAYVEVAPIGQAEVEAIDVVSLFRSLGLHWRILSDGQAMVVARKKKLIDGLTEALEEEGGGRSEAAERRIGVLLGYPLTATDYYLRRSATMGTDHQLPMVAGDDVPFHPVYGGFVVSPEHYQDELQAYCQPLEAAVRELAPALYVALTESYEGERAEHAADIREINSR